MKNKLSLLGVVLVGVFAVPTAAAAQPAPPNGTVHRQSSAAGVAAANWAYQGRFEIRNSYIARCMDAHANGGGLNGNLVGLFDCNGGITEKWHVWLKTSRNDWAWTGHPLQHWRFVLA